MTKQELKEDVKLRKNGGQLDNIQISVLINSIYYFIESVYIMTVKNGYRLVVIQQRQLLTDKTYKTPRGARITFLKLYGHKAWQEGVKAIWSKFYSPLPGWCDAKMPSRHFYLKQKPDRVTTTVQIPKISKVTTLKIFYLYLPRPVGRF